MTDEMRARERVMGLPIPLGKDEPSVRRVAALIASVREECAKIAAGYRLVRASPIGHQHGAGWNEAVMLIERAIRDGEDDASKPEGT